MQYSRLFPVYYEQIVNERTGFVLYEPILLLNFANINHIKK